jgi:hypothetical protein
MKLGHEETESEERELGDDSNRGRKTAKRIGEKFDEIRELDLTVRTSL